LPFLFIPPMKKKNKKKPAAQKYTLSPSQELFCHEYLKDRNVTQAAIRAGYSARSADSKGSQLLARPLIQYRVNRLIEAQLGRIDLKADFVVKEILKLATFDIQDIFDKGGNLKAVEDMPENVRKAVASIEIFEEFEGQGKKRKSIGFTKKIKFWPKDKALEMLGKYLKMFGDVNILPGGTLIFQDIKIEQQEAPQLLSDINTRLSMQFSKQ